MFHIWQYSSEGSVAGIDGNVDMDTAYVDLETVIKNNYLNGFAACQPEPEQETTELTIEERVARLEERVSRLEA